MAPKKYYGIEEEERVYLPLIHPPEVRLKWIGKRVMVRGWLAAWERAGEEREGRPTWRLRMQGYVPCMDTYVWSTDLMRPCASDEREEYVTG